VTAPELSVQTANGRYYLHPSNRSSVPSITNIIGMLDKPALKYWAAREAADYAAENIQKLATLSRDEAYQLIKGAPFRRDDESPGAVGDLVHSWIDLFIKNERAQIEEELKVANNTAKWMWQSFLKFAEKYRPTFTNSEFTVWSDKHGYAGTADLAMRINGAHVLADTKTGKNVYPETAMQLAALAHADVVLESDGTEQPIPSFDRYAVLHLRPRSAQLVPVDKIDAAFQCFLALKQAFDWKVQHADSTLGFSPKIN
jgi:hypothetical protein